MSNPGLPGPADERRPPDAHDQVRSVVVVGAGLAGARTVATLRAHGFDGHLTVLGAEGVAPYDRPPLSKALLERTEPAWLTEELGIDLPDLADDIRFGEPAAGLTADASGVEIRTSRDHAGSRSRTSSTLRADIVVLACGSHASRPAGWEAALTLHTAADAARLREALTPGSRLIVIGAGWIGAEVAGVAAAAGVEVTVVEAGDAPLARQLGESIGALTAPWYTAAGIRLLTGTAVDTVDDAGVLLTDGRYLPADVVLAATGAAPATGWLNESVPLTARRAVPVDSAGRLDVPRGVSSARLAATDAARVWAVGDCADRWTARFGDVAGGHWSGALSHPEAVACAITGAAAPAEAAPSVFSQQLGHYLTLIGIPAAGSDVVHRGAPEGGDGWTTLWFSPATRDAPGNAAGRELLAVLTVDRPRDVGPARRLLSGRRPSRLDLARATDPSVHLSEAVVD